MTRFFVTGGSASGKSAYAEDLVLSFSSARYYLATMDPCGTSAQERIRRHLALRSGKGFITVECEGGLAGAFCKIEDPDSTVLVEDLGNLVARLLFCPDGAMRQLEHVCDLIANEMELLDQRCARLVIVGNEIGADGIEYDSATRAYIELVGMISCRLAAWCDVVVEVAAGCPQVVKGVL